MRTTAVLLVTALAAAAVSAPALADNPPAPGTKLAGPAAARPKPPARHVFGGTVSAVGSDTLTVQVTRTGPNDGSLGGLAVTVAIDGSTQIVEGKDRKPIQLAGIQTGDAVGIGAVEQVNDPASLLAKRVHVVRRSHWAAGYVTATGSDSVTLSIVKTGPHDGSYDGQSVTFAVAGDTSIVLGHDRTPIQLSGVSAGQRVGVVFQASGSNLTATRMHVWRNDHWIGGTVTAVSSASITVQVTRTGPFDRQLGGTSVTVGLDPATAWFRGRSTPITRQDVKAGDRVGIVFHASNGDYTQGTTALRVRDWGVKQPAPEATGDTSIQSVASDAGAAAGTADAAAVGSATAAAQ